MNLSEYQDFLKNGLKICKQRAAEAEALTKVVFSTFSDVEVQDDAWADRIFTPKFLMGDAAKLEHVVLEAGEPIFFALVNGHRIEFKKSYDLYADSADASNAAFLLMQSDGIPTFLVSKCKELWTAFMDIYSHPQVCADGDDWEY